MALFKRGRATVLDPNNATNTAAAGLRGGRVSDAITASGMRIKPTMSGQVRRLVQPWQIRAFNYYDQLGEIKYAAQFYARMLSPLRLFAAEVDEHGEIVESENPDAVDALVRMQDPGGGRTGLLASYGRLMFLAGECYLFVSIDPDTGLEQWEMLSTDELLVQQGTYIRYKSPSLAAEAYRESREDEDVEGAWVPVDDRTAVAYRLWNRHPRFSQLADSTMMGVLDLAEELLMLTLAVRARARSRLAGSGIMVIDDRISMVPLEAVPDEDPQADPFLAAFTRSMTLPIENQGAASAVVPLVIRATAPDGGRVADLIHHLPIVDPTQLYPETGLRMECIKRIAIGLDMPPEILLGTADVNHWGAWQIDEQTWKGHGAPLAQRLCDDLTSAYFRPYLRDVLRLPDWQRYIIAFDATEIINHPDRTRDAKDAYASRAIGKEALRKYLGFPDEDAMTEEERAESVGIAVRDPSLAWFGIPAPRGIGGLEVAPGEVEPAGSGAPPGEDSTGASVEKGPPPKGAPTQDQEEGVVAALVARITGAADLAMLRSREAAGSRVRSLAKRNPEMLALLNGTPNSEVVAKLGREGLRKLNAPPERELVSDAARLVEDAIRMWDLSPEVGALVAQTVEQHAARTLYDPRPAPLPGSFTGYLVGMLRS